jgi:hypothetical protein
LNDPLKPPVMTPAEKEVDEDRKRQLNTLIGLSDEKHKEVLSKDNQAKRQLDTLIGLSDQLGPLIREN